MKTVKSHLDTLADRSLEFPEAVAATSLYYTVTSRARRAREDGERGAVSIEQAIITIAVIAFAIVILAVISTVVHNLAGQVTTPSVPDGTK